MKAVIWADVVQMVIIMIGCLVLVIMGSLKAGGIKKVFNIADDGGRLIFDE